MENGNAVKIGTYVEPGDSNPYDLDLFCKIAEIIWRLERL